MRKVSIIGSKYVLPGVIETLHKLKLVHIVDYTKGDELDIGAPFEENSDISDLLVKTRTIAKHLNVRRKVPGTVKRSEEDRKLIRKKIEKIEKEVVEKVDELKAIAEKLKKMNELKKNLEPLSKMPLKIEDYAGYSSIAPYVGYIKAPADFEKELGTTIERYEFFSSKHKSKYVIALFVDVKEKEKADALLMKHSFTPVKSENSELNGHPEEIISHINSHEIKLNSDIERIKKSLEKLSDKYEKFLSGTEQTLFTGSEKAEAPMRFATTKEAFIGSGWVPADKCSELKNALEKITNQKIFLRFSDEPDRTTPVKLKNPRAVKPFEFLINLYSLPKYNEIDPTFFVALSFPLFFGIILGDIGYGLVTLFIFYLLKMKMKPFAPIANIFIISSLSTIFFGFIFGEFFGLENIFGYELQQYIHRAHELESLLLYTALIGLVSVNIGYALGFMKELSHGFGRALTEKGSWIIMEIGIALAALDKLGYVSGTFNLGILITAFSVVLIYKGEGIKGIVEIPGLLSNVLSYMRLAAVGMASVILAVLVNEFAFGAFHAGGIGIVLGAILLLIGHTINILLGLLGGFLHSLRLNYVEFFTKFYEGGGMKYRAFGEHENQEV